ncbi:MAG: aspartate aminotransferase family protein [Candidatus Rokuibacteriota bacterium]|nr:MAG: aspartate aminotransferase family protein [Candidatus Rokubacteria bacterium]
MEAINERFQRLHPGSMALFERAKTLFPHGVTHDGRRLEPFSVYVTHAMGGRKWDVDGNEYIDFRMGHGALILGHSHPDIVRDVQAAMARGTHLGLSHELEIRWAERVKELVPSIQKMRFTASGTEATMMAVRLARAYTDKAKVLKFTEHFHGWNDHGIIGSGRSAGGVPPEVKDTVVVLPQNDIELVDRTLAAAPDFAAVILEPTGAHGGMYPAYPEFVRQLRDVTRRHGVLLIFDEVVTGFRISKGGAQVRYGIEPDLTCLAKILGGGLPCGACGGRADLVDMIAFRGDSRWDTTKRVAHHGTFNANPLAAAAGLRAMELVATTPVNANADRNAQRLKDGLNQVFQQAKVPGHAHGVASIVNIQVGAECDCDRVICTQPLEKLKDGTRAQVLQPLYRASLNAGLDWMGGTFFVSAVHTERDIDDSLNAFEEALTACQHEDVV